MRYLTIALFTIFICSCSPTVRYFGDTSLPTKEIDTYYSKDDITTKYKVIGQLSGYQRGSSKEELKLKMIEEAKQKGANGILFLLLESDIRYTNETVTPVKADLLLYEE